jgi:hypothetical protein
LNRVSSPAIGPDDDYEVRKILTQKVNNFLPLRLLERERASNIFVIRVTWLMRRQQLARGIRQSDPWMRDRMERYCTLHPRSPSAVRRPQLSRRRGTFVVLLGHSLENGIVGIGNTVENALRAFDLQYLRALEPQPNGAEIVSRSLKPTAVAS